MTRIRFAGADDRQAVLPKFTTVRSVTNPVENLETDLFLMPMLSGMAIPQSLHAEDPALAESIKTAIKDSGFKGKAGSHLVVETSLPGAAGTKRYVLLVGLGRPNCFNADVASAVFKLLTEQAVALGVRRVTVPFISNRMTRECLNIRGTTRRLKQAVAQRLSELGDSANLEEVQIMCSTQAKRYVEQGLESQVEIDDCGCNKKK